MQTRRNKNLACCNKIGCLLWTAACLLWVCCNKLPISLQQTCCLVERGGYTLRVPYSTQMRAERPSQAVPVIHFAERPSQPRVHSKLGSQGQPESTARRSHGHVIFCCIGTDARRTSIESAGGQPARTQSTEGRAAAQPRVHSKLASRRRHRQRGRCMDSHDQRDVETQTIGNGPMMKLEFHQKAAVPSLILLIVAWLLGLRRCVSGLLK